METILQQIYSELVKNSLKIIKELGLNNLDQLSRELLELSNTSVNEIISSLATELNAEVVNDKSGRKENGLTIKEHNMKRCIHLPTGELKLKRTYFEKDNGNCKERVYPIDKLLGIDSYERISKGVVADMVQNTAEYSYEKSALNVSNGVFSRQTVRNKVLRIGELAIVPEKRDETPKDLHIFADEDHVHMQDGRGEIVRLITTSEGIENVSKGRNKLIHPVHYEGYGIKPAVQWEYVYAVLSDTYDMDKVEKVFIHGDGAPWINKANEVFPKAIHLLDPYHLNKYIKKMTADADLKKYKNLIWRALKNNSIRTFEHVLCSILKDVENIYAGDEKYMKKKKDNILKAAEFIVGNIDKISNRLKYKEVGSCTEPLVSHILSERLSRNPMGWSKVGLSKVTMVRVYVKNGGIITSLDVDKDKVKKNEERQVISCIKKYEKMADKLLEDVISDSTNWKWLDKEHFSNGKTSGTSVLMRNAGRIKVS